MVQYKLAFIAIFFASAFSNTHSSEANSFETGRMFFMIQSGHHQEAIQYYEDYYSASNKHDFDLLQKIGLAILDQGYRSSDPESQLLTLFGAGISGHDETFYILEEGLKNRNPQLQLVALNLLSQNTSDRADEVLARAMASQFLPIRLEACFALAKKHHSTAVAQAESLMYKLPKEILPLFPQIFAVVGTEPATRILRKLFSHPLESVRIEAILCTSRYGRDDLLPQVRLLATHLNAPQLEACASVFGELKDESTISKLEKLSSSPITFVSLASLQALYRLGLTKSKEKIEKMALENNLFAINILGEMPGSEDVLCQLIKSSYSHVRVNAAIALLRRRNANCLTGIAEILIHDARDYAFVKILSPGRSMEAWKVIPSASHNLSDSPDEYEISMSLREQTLIDAMQLPEKDFFLIADALFQTEQNDLIPTLVKLLEQLETPASIELLQKYQQKLGAPLVRHYCNLALYRLKIPGPYAVNLRNWVKETSHVDIINFRHLIPWEKRDNTAHYQLTPKETSRLLIEAFEAFATHQDEAGIEALVEAIHYGNAKNKYALAGLLVRATQ